MAITGIIRPPPEIRAVADRTASYVAKNGRTFESRILKSAKGKTPKFAFLQPTSPFHAYYEDRIKFYEDGGDDEEEAKGEETKEETKKEESKNAAVSTARKTEKTQVASAIDPIARVLLAQRAKIAKSKALKTEEEQQSPDGETGSPAKKSSIIPPEPLDLINIVAPSNLTPAQMEIIQLVAQFAAMDGKGGTFLHQLSSREWNNREFAFCQPRHSHFAYFSALVDAYRSIITDWTATTPSEKTDSSQVDKAKYLQEALEEAAYRAEYERDRNQQKSQQEEGEIVAIDWHDFVVVETIDFPVDEKVELSMLPPPPPTSSLPAAALPTAGDEMDEDSDDDEGETIRVVPSYTPKVVGTAKPQAARAIDPITGKSVSVADVPEHLRIQLLDPKWAEERKKFQDKQKESNLVAGEDIVSNLSKYSQAKGDLFGKSVSEERGTANQLATSLRYTSSGSNICTVPLMHTRSKSYWTKRKVRKDGWKKRTASSENKRTKCHLVVSLVLRRHNLRWLNWTSQMLNACGWMLQLAVLHQVSRFNPNLLPSQRLHLHLHLSIFPTRQKHQESQWLMLWSMLKAILLQSPRATSFFQKANLLLLCPNQKSHFKYAYPTILHKWRGIFMGKFYRLQSTPCLLSNRSSLTCRKSISMACLSTKSSSKPPVLHSTTITMLLWHP